MNGDEVKRKSGKSVYQLDDVQELAKGRPAKVPERYIRPREERASATEYDNDAKIPVIDMRKLLQPRSAQEKKDELARLYSACADWGIFEVENAGVDRGVVEEMKRQGIGFFKELPLEEREKYAMEAGGIQGYGHGFVFSKEQKLDWCDMFALGTYPASVRIPRLWPSNPPRFSEAVEAYARSMMAFSISILRAMSEALGLPPDAIIEAMGPAEERVQAVRMNYYPPCSQHELVLGLPPHSDGSAVTILTEELGEKEDEEEGKDEEERWGLEVVDGRSGKWVRVEVKEMLVNVGDSIEVMSNGRFRSCEHRAVVSKNRERMSIATFHAPSYATTVGPLPALVDEVHPALFRRYSHAEFNRHYLSHPLNHKHSLDFALLPSSPPSAF